MAVEISKLGHNFQSVVHDLSPTKTDTKTPQDGFTPPKAVSYFSPLPHRVITSNGTLTANTNISIEELHLRENLQLSAYLSDPQKMKTLQKIIGSKEKADDGLKKRLGDIQDAEKLAEKVAPFATIDYRKIKLENLMPQSLIDYLELRKTRIDLHSIKIKLDMGISMQDILEIPKLSDEDSKIAKKALDKSIKAGNKVLAEYFITGFNAANKAKTKLDNTRKGLDTSSPSYTKITRKIEVQEEAHVQLNLDQTFFAAENKPEQEFQRLRDTLRDQYLSNCCIIA